MAGFSLHPTLSIPWVWASPDIAMRIWRASFVVCAVVLSIAWFGIWTWPTPNQATPIPDFIDGTNVTQTDLWNTFPFGYTVFSRGTGQQWRYEKFTSDKYQFDIDPKSVGIEPNFSKGTVTWTIPLKGNPPAGQPGLRLEDSLARVEAPLTPKVATRVMRMHLMPGEQPELYVSTLSNDQRFPVFALGYRIPMPPSESTPDMAASPH